MRPGVVTVAEDASLHAGAARDGRPRRPCRPDHRRRRTARLGHRRLGCCPGSTKEPALYPAKTAISETVAYIPPGASAREALQALSDAGGQPSRRQPARRGVAAGRRERDRPRPTRLRGLIRSAPLRPADPTRWDAARQRRSWPHAPQRPSASRAHRRRRRALRALARRPRPRAHPRPRGRDPPDPRRRLSRRGPLRGHAAPRPRDRPGRGGPGDARMGRPARWPASGRRSARCRARPSRAACSRSPRRRTRWQSSSGPRTAARSGMSCPAAVGERLLARRALPGRRRAASATGRMRFRGIRTSASASSPTPEADEALCAAVGIALRTGATIRALSVVELPAARDHGLRLGLRQARADSRATICPRASFARSATSRRRWRSPARSSTAMPTTSWHGCPRRSTSSSAAPAGAARSASVMLGSVAAGVLRKARCPVLVVPRGAHDGFANLRAPASAAA